MKVFFSRQFVLFVMVGGCAAVVNFVSRFLYELWFSFSGAILLAYVTGMVTAFTLYKFFVFAGSIRPIHHSMAYFTLVNLAGVVQTWGITMALTLYLFPSIGFTWFPKEFAHMCGLVVPGFTSFLGHRYITFKNLSAMVE